MGEIRVTIEDKTKPRLLDHLTRTQEDIRSLRISQVQINLIRIEELARRGYLTPQELEAAKQEAGQILGTVQFKEPEQPKPKKLLPDGQEIDVTDFQFRVLQPLFITSKETPITNDYWAESIYSDNAPVQTKRNRLQTAMRNLRPALEEKGYQIVNLKAQGEPGGAYYLEKVTAEPLQETEPTLPKITLNFDTREVNIDGRKVKIQGSIIWAVMLYFAQNPRREIPSQEIEKIAEDAGSKSKYAAGKAVNNLMRAVGMTKEMLARTGRMASSNYILNAEVEIIGQIPQKIEATKPEAPKKFPLIPVYGQKIAALNAFIDNPNITLSEIVNILGPSRKTGRSLTTPQVFWSLKVQGGTNLLYIRIRDGIASQAEQDLWVKVKQFTGQDEDRAAFELFNNKIEEWYKSRRTVTPAQVAQVEAIKQLEVQEPTIEEATVLGEFLLVMNSVIFLPEDKEPAEFDIEEDVIEAVKSLIGEVRIRTAEGLNEIFNDYIEKRAGVLEKFVNIIRSEKLEEFLDKLQDENIKTLLMWLHYQDAEEISRMFLDLSSKTPEVIEYEARELMAILQGWITPTSEQSPSDNEPSTLPVPPVVSYVEPQTRAQIPIIERRDPEVRKRVNDLLDEIAQAQISKLLSVGKLTHAFNRLKAGWIRIAEEDRHYVQPQRRNGHPLFAVDEIALLLYVKDFGNGLSIREVKSLKDVILEELIKHQNKES